MSVCVSACMCVCVSVCGCVCAFVHVCVSVCGYGMPRCGAGTCFAVNVTVC